MARTTKIPLQNLRTLQNRVSRSARRAAGRGMPATKLTVVREFGTWTDVPDGFERMRGNTGATRRVAVPMVEVSVDGGDPQVGRWGVVGYRVSPKARNPVFLEYGDVPAEMRGRPLCCEHCDTQRRRKATFVLRDGESGEPVEVGGTCVGDFTGVDGGLRMLEGLSDIAGIHRMVAEAASPEWAHGGVEERMEESRLVMAVAKRVLSEHGWVSSVRSKATGEPATFRLVGRALELSRTEGATILASTVPLASDFLAADEAAAWAKAGSEGSDFLSAAAVALERGVAGVRDVAVLTAAANAHSVALRRAAESGAEAEATAKSKHVGRVGDRIELVVRVLGVTPFESKYGSGTRVRMLDADGNCLVWLSSSSHGMSEGRAYAVKGTVGEHAEIRTGASEGAPETKLKRVSVTSDLGPVSDVYSAREAPELSAVDADALDALFGSAPQPGL
jgi:hypothetical protein